MIDIDAVLQKHFGLIACSPYQKLVITNILEASGMFPDQGNDSSPQKQLVILPTGAGKSICFMVPGVIIEGITLVIYPLLALMNDQSERLKQSGIPVELLRGGQTQQERKNMFYRLTKYKRAFLLTNPEAIQIPSVPERLQRLHIMHTVIDEAHIVYEWGTTFRPAYLKLGRILQNIGCTQVTAFTATASQTTIQAIKEYLFSDARVHIIHSDTDRPNLFYKAIPSISKIHDLQQLLASSHREHPSLVFCRRRASTEYLARLFRLRLQKKEIYCYHAGMHRKQRERIEKWFYASEDGILFATNAFGMGVDKNNIRTVVHFDIPASISAYLQESGRAGRDGKPAFSVILFTPKETDHQAESELITYLLYTDICRRKTLLKQFSIKEPETCFGCDVCRNSCITVPNGYNEIEKFLTYTHHKLSLSDAAAVLSGSLTKTAVQKRFFLNKGFGLLSSWCRDDVEQALRTAADLKGKSKIHFL